MRAVLLTSFLSFARTQDDMPDMSSMMGGLGGNGMGGMGDMASMMGSMGGGGGGMGGMGDLASMMGGMGGGGGMGGMPGMGGGGGGGEPPPEPFPAVKSDVKFIVCSTCKALARKLHAESSKWGSAITGSEEAIAGKVAEMCETASEAGSWITEYDMVESSDGKAINLKRHSQKGECEVECNTIKQACKDVLQEADIEVASALYKAFKKKQPLDAKALTAKMCTSDDAAAANMVGGCATKRPKIPKNRKAGPAFRVKELPPDISKMDVSLVPTPAPEDNGKPDASASGEAKEEL
ncbi:unnamed protein product [Prorocentrum cordatum]|uniref:Saposin B-type domain-containing protein n=1 Tax=Prorocentrum cordatum TaxID=2364126 RepID=A0ABN9YAU0_9DINO|nr:unnamed protein product [Polarella glacialis]